MQIIERLKVKSAPALLGIIFLILLGCYLFINFVLTHPNTFQGGPWNPDDYQALAYSFQDYSPWMTRSVSVTLKYIFATTGAGIFYLILHALTVLYATLAIYFLIELFDLKQRNTYFFLCTFGICLFAFPATLAYGHYLGLITDLSSCVFGACTLLFLLKGFKYHSAWYYAGLLSYCLAIFSKEDFILPPLLFALYLLIANFQTTQKIKPPASLIVMTFGLFTVLAFFLFYNFYLVVNPFITDASHTKTLHRSLHFFDLFRAFHFYMIRQGVAILGTSAWLIFTSLWFFTTKETSTRTKIGLAFLITPILLFPYLVIADHADRYYAYTWLPWQIGLAICALYFGLPQIKSTVRRRIAIILMLLFIGLSYQTRARLAQYYMNVYNNNQNILSSLLKYQSILNTQKYVGIIGLQGSTPWVNNPGDMNSENRGLYLNNKLGFKNNWILFVPPNNPVYNINPNNRFISDHRVNVLSLSKCAAFPGQYNIFFDVHGHGILAQSCTLNLGNS